MTQSPEQYQLFYEEQFDSRDVVTEFMLLTAQEAEMLEARISALSDLGVIAYASLVKLRDVEFLDFAKAAAIFDHATLRAADMPSR